MIHLLIIIDSCPVPTNFNLIIVPYNFRKKKFQSCNKCENCTRLPCGKCRYCLDKIYHGNRSRKKCVARKCILKSPKNLPKVSIDSACDFSVICQSYRVRYSWGRVPNFNQSETRKQCFLASDWLKFGTPGFLQKFSTTYLIIEYL